MILHKLVIENFKGIRKFEMKADGQNVSIHGANRCGKTTIADAVSWLMYGKDMQDRTGFEVKALDSKGQIVPELREAEHSVEAVFDVGTFKRVFKEKWVKSRGKATAEYTGNTTEYFVNEIAVSKKDFDAKIESIAPADVFKLVTNPMYFHTILPWQKRRDILIKEFGQVSPEDVYSANPDLLPLREILSDVSFEDAKSKYSRRMSAINERLKQIPTRIDEAQKSIPDVDGSVKELAAKSDELTAAKNAEWLRGESLKNGTGRSEKQRRIVDLQTEQAKIKRSVEESDEAINSPIRSRNHSAKTQYEDSMRKIETAERNIVSLVGQAERIQKLVDSLREEWNKENAHTWENTEYPINGTCPACGQALPHERLQAAIESAKAEFNRTRAARLQSISDMGKSNAEALKDTQAQIEEQKKIVESLRGIERPVLEPEQHTDYRTTPEYLAIDAEIKKLQEEIVALDSGVTGELDEVNAKIREIEMTRSEISRKIAAIEMAEKTRERIQELIAEQKALGVEYEDLAKKIFLLERFTVSQCEMVEANVNANFREVSFKLFDQQINGGINLTCEALYDGIPVSTNTSRSENTKAGLDIIRTMSERFGFSAPIFIDDRESITEIPDMSGIQLINLYVSPEDKVLRVEKE